MKVLAISHIFRNFIRKIICVDYNREVLATYGLTVADAAEQVSAAMHGYKAGEIIRNLGEQRREYRAQ